MPLIEAGQWIANEAEDVSRPRAWAVERRTPGFPDAVFADVCAAVSEPSVRTSMMDVAPDYVLGLIRSRHHLTAFCVHVTNYAQIALWLASTDSSTSSYDLARTWLEVLSGDLVNKFKWTAAVDTAALDLPVSDRSVAPAARVSSRDGRIAVRESDRGRRLRICCDIFDRLRSRSPVAPSLALVDGLTVIRGNRFQVAGLVPTYRHVGSDWTVIDRPAAAEPGRALARFCSVVSATARGTPDAPDETADGFFDGWAAAPDEPTQGLVETDQFASALLARDAILQAMDRGVTSHGTRLAGNEREMFEQPARLVESFPGAMNASSPSAAIFALVGRALIIARFPAVALELDGVFVDWLDGVDEHEIRLRALVLSELAQPVYDQCKKHTDRGDRANILQRLDGLIDRLVETVELLSGSAQEADAPVERWSDADREAFANAFDRLSELETTSPQRDRKLLRAGMIVRLVADLPTPDVIDRAVRTTLVENSPMLVRLISRSHHSAALTEVGAIAVADVLGMPLDEGRRRFGGMFAPAAQASISDTASNPAAKDAGRGDGNSAGFLPIFNSFRLD